MKFNSYLAETASPSPWRGQTSAPLLQDSFARTFNYLRLSITERCNFRCEYCLPHGYQATAEQAPELSRQEIQRLVRGFATLGLTKVRLTGGEPSLRKDLCAIIADIAAPWPTSGSCGLRRSTMALSGLADTGRSAINGWDGPNRGAVDATNVPRPTTASKSPSCVAI